MANFSTGFMDAGKSSAVSKVNLEIPVGNKYVCACGRQTGDDGYCPFCADVETNQNFLQTITSYVRKKR